MLCADDFVYICVIDSKENVQKLIDVVQSYCTKWRLRANLSKSAVMVFSKDAVNVFEMVRVSSMDCLVWLRNILYYSMFLRYLTSKPGILVLASSTLLEALLN